MRMLAPDAEMSETDVVSEAAVAFEVAMAFEASTDNFTLENFNDDFHCYCLINDILKVFTQRE
jgi:hypothetical protein